MPQQENVIVTYYNVRKLPDLNYTIFPYAKKSTIHNILLSFKLKETTLELQYRINKWNSGSELLTANFLYI